MVKNLPTNVGDVGSIPKSRKVPHAAEQISQCVQLLNLCSRAPEQQLLKPMCPGDCAPEQEKPQQWEAGTPQLESRHHTHTHTHSPQLKKSQHSNEDPAQPKEIN